VIECAADGAPGKVLLQHPTTATAIGISADSRWLLTTSREHGMRFWDLATGRAISPPVPASGLGLAQGPYSEEWAPALLSDGSQAFVSRGEEILAWDRPEPMSGTVDEVRARIELITAQRMDADGVVHPLDPAAWQALRLANAAGTGASPVGDKP
jgi:hypothetical protein